MNAIESPFLGAALAASSAVTAPKAIESPTLRSGGAAAAAGWPGTAGGHGAGRRGGDVGGRVSSSGRSRS